jgi:hypothetical protein
VEISARTPAAQRVTFVIEKSEEVLDTLHAGVEDGLTII